MSRPVRPRRRLSARIVAKSLLLLLVVQAASFGVIRSQVDASARQLLGDELKVGERMWARLIDQRAQALGQSAEVLAADSGFKEAVGSHDAATIASALANHGERLHARFTAMLDTARAPTVVGEDSDARVVPELARLTTAMATMAPPAGSARNTVALVGGEPYQFVMVPMKAPVVIGWIVMGFPIDAAVARDMKGLSGLDVALVAQRGAGQRVALSTLGPETAAPLLAATASARGEVTLGGQMHVIGEAATGRQAQAGDRDERLRTLLLRNADVALAPYHALQVMLAAITALGVVLFGLGSAFTARRITTPLNRLADAAARLGSGDYTTPVPEQERADEIGQLAETFEAMRVGVADHEAQILKLAYWDTLTGLPNRVQFRDAVGEAIAQAAAGAAPLAVLMLDLDRFKHVNDVLGYRIGDLLLKAVGERLARQVKREGDLVARLSGDEFAVMLRGADAALAEQVAQRIAQAFAEPLTLEEHKVDMGAGIGMACWPQHAADADTLLSRAEVAMYAAKRRTAGPLLYDASIDAASAQTLSLLSELRQAVDQGELRLYLQPKLALDTGAIAGAETLVRWQHPTRGLVPPMQFIPFAEQTGFIRVLTMWVFETAARQWLALHAEGLQLVLSVNLSTRDLLDPDLPAKFDALLVQHRVPAEAFCLEITESAIMDDPQRALATLNRLSALGFKLSIDDFGTGYSSLAYLKRLPVDELKIDKSFVMSMETDLDDAKIVKSTIDLAHNLGLTVVAEGVENARVWEQLRGLDCDQAQGYHMGKPMPADDFLRWSAGWAAKSIPVGRPGLAVLH